MNRIAAGVVRHPGWTSCGAAIGIVGVVLSIVQLAVPTGGKDAGEKNSPDLEVAALELGSAEQIDGVNFSIFRDYPEDPTAFDVTPVDITLKNNGGSQSVITQVNAEVLFSAMLHDCTGSGAGPAAIRANYALRFPVDEDSYELKPGSVSTGTQFIVKPGSVDRMQLTVGPQSQSGNAFPTVLAVRISLIHDGSQILDVGAVALPALPEKIEEQIHGLRTSAVNINEPDDPECAEENLTKLDELYAIDSVRAPNLDQLRAKYQQQVGRAVSTESASAPPVDPGPKLRALADDDRAFVSSSLHNLWVPQISSKRVGLQAEGVTWDNAQILREHLLLRQQYPNSRLLWSGDWPSLFSIPDFWVTIVGTPYPDETSAQNWCTDHDLDPDHCFAKFVGG